MDGGLVGRNEAAQCRWDKQHLLELAQNRNLCSFLPGAQFHNLEDFSPLVSSVLCPVLGFCCHANQSRPISYCAILKVGTTFVMPKRSKAAMRPVDLGQGSRALQALSWPWEQGSQVMCKEAQAS